MSNRCSACFGCLVAVVAIMNAAPALCAGVPAHLRVELDDQSGLSARVVEGLKAEVEHLWRTQCCIDWSDRARPECGDGRAAAPLFVTLLAQGAPGLRHDVIATIRFIGGRPLNRVDVYAPHARHLVEQGLGTAPGYHQWPAAARDDAFGRVIGRAIAHEIGHFLLRSPVHTASGLMKARHRANELAGWGRRGFELDATSAAALAMPHLARADRTDDDAAGEETF